MALGMAAGCVTVAPRRTHDFEADPLMRIRPTVFAALAACLFGPHLALAQNKPPQAPMGFFVTSTGIGRGGDLGGLEGADRHCQALATAVGAGGRMWRAFLSASPTGGQAIVNARDESAVGPGTARRGTASPKAWSICSATRWCTPG